MKEREASDEIASAPFDKSAAAAFGRALVISGVILLIFGLLGTGVTTCPPTGCPPSVLSTLAWRNAILFLSGIALIAMGIASLRAARRAKLRPTTSPLSQRLQQTNESGNYHGSTTIPAQALATVIAVEIPGNPDNQDP